VDAIGILERFLETLLVVTYGSLFGVVTLPKFLEQFSNLFFQQLLMKHHALSVQNFKFSNQKVLNGDIYFLIALMIISLPKLLFLSNLYSASSINQNALEKVDEIECLSKGEL